MKHLLYKREAAWGLPSLLPGCIQAEALLRFAGTDFEVLVHTEPGRSPTNFYPALEKDRELVTTENCVTEFDCVRRIHASLTSTSSDVDSHLMHAEAATAKALCAFVEQNLEPATLYTAWCEKEGFKQYSNAFGGKLPFPLNFVVAKTEQRRISRLLSKQTSDEIYARACAALESISHVLADRNGYLLGDTPCSADAYVYGHLVFYRVAPVSSPMLQQKLNELNNVKAYVERIAQNYFTEVAPVLESVEIAQETEEEMMSAWSTATPVAHGDNLWSAKKLWDELQKMDKLSKWWLGGATTLLLAYSWFRPPFVFMIDQDGSFADEEDDSE